MENLLKENLLRILSMYQKLEKNIIYGKELDDVYELLPHKMTIATPGAKIQAINQFVILNCQEIIKIINSKDNEDKVDVDTKEEDIIQPAKENRPKTIRKPRSKTKAKPKTKIK